MVFLIAGFIIGIVIVALAVDWGANAVLEEDKKKIEAMGRAGIIYTNRLSKDKKPSDEISRPIKQNGFEQHKMIKPD